MAFLGTFLRDLTVCLCFLSIISYRIIAYQSYYSRLFYLLAFVWYIHLSYQWLVKKCGPSFSAHSLSDIELRFAT